MPSAGFEPAIPASERREAHALDRATSRGKQVQLLSSLYLNVQRTGYWRITLSFLVTNL
jgi:hypothetical protein